MVNVKKKSLNTKAYLFEHSFYARSPPQKKSQLKYYLILSVCRTIIYFALLAWVFLYIKTSTLCHLILKNYNKDNLIDDPREINRLAVWDFINVNGFDPPPEPLRIPSVQNMLYKKHKLLKVK